MNSSSMQPVLSLAAPKAVSKRAALSTAMDDFELSTAADEFPEPLS